MSESPPPAKVPRLDDAGPSHAGSSGVDAAGPSHAGSSGLISFIPAASDQIPPEKTGPKLGVQQDPSGSGFFIKGELGGFRTEDAARVAATHILPLLSASFEGVRVGDIVLNHEINGYDLSYAYLRFRKNIPTFVHNQLEWFYYPFSNSWVQVRTDREGQAAGSFFRLSRGWPTLRTAMKPRPGNKVTFTEAFLLDGTRFFIISMDFEENLSFDRPTPNTGLSL